MTNLLIKLFVKNDDRTAYGLLSSITGIVCNIILFTVKFIMGIISGSIAVTSDAFNNLSDLCSCVVTLATYKMAAKPADKDHPFGHGRMEYLASLFIAGLIIMVGFEFIKTSFDRLLHPSTVNFNMVVFASLVASVLLKLWMYLFNKKLAGITKSTAMEATSKDSLSDSLTTTVTVISLIISPLTKLPIDGAIGIVVSLLILKSGYEIVKDTVDTLLGQPADKEVVDEMMEIVKSHDVVLGVHDLIVHNYGPGNMMATLHVEIDSKSDILMAHEQIDDIERDLYDIMHIRTTIHMDPIEVGNEETNVRKEAILRYVKEYDERISMHDFRMVKGEGHTNLIFDLVIPHELVPKKQLIKESLQARVNQDFENHYLVIDFDTDFN